MLSVGSRKNVRMAINPGDYSPVRYDGVKFQCRNIKNPRGIERGDQPTILQGIIWRSDQGWTDPHDLVVTGSYTSYMNKIPDPLPEKLEDWNPDF